MILKRFYNDHLAQASFLAGCSKTGEALVIDPNRDFDQYTQAAAESSLRIVAVTETHIHADFISGSRELASRLSAKLYLSDEGGADWNYRFAGEPNVKLVRGGDSISIGALRFDVVRTPGHTPEHISFVLGDAAFTGDFIFVGEVGRPDLLERAAGFEGTMAAGAKSLFSSLQEFSANHPDTMTLWPGHGAGSSCGKNLSNLPSSLLGQERQTNWALKVANEREFIETVLSGQPAPPHYFKRMKIANRDGPKIIGEIKAPAELDGNALRTALAAKDQIVDLRPVAEMELDFIPGVLSLPLNKSFVTWAGWLLSYDSPIYLIAPDAVVAAQAVKNLALIGIEGVKGWFAPALLKEAGFGKGGVEELKRTGPKQASAMIAGGKTTVLDVRNLDEYSAGNVSSAIHIPLGDLDLRCKELPADRPILIYCQGGARSSIAYTLLRRRGFNELIDLDGGFRSLNHTPPSPAPK